MKKIIGPNWPDWPTAYFDERRKRVRVTGIAPTWRSHLKADRDTQIATLLALGLAGYAFLNASATSKEELDVNSLLTACAVGLVGWAVLAWRVIHPFFLNTHHAKSFRLELTPDDIRVNGQRFKRRHKHGHLIADFRIIEDDEAAEHLNTKGIENLKVRHRATTSRKVQVILRGQCDHGVVSAELLGPGQVITLATVLGNEKAELVSVVCQAAEGLVEKLSELD